MRLGPAECRGDVDGGVLRAERDVHEGRLVGYALLGQPPDARVDMADGDARARACQPRRRPVL